MDIFVTPFQISAKLVVRRKGVFLYTNFRLHPAVWTIRWFKSVSYFIYLELCNILHTQNLYGRNSPRDEINIPYLHCIDVCKSVSFNLTGHCCWTGHFILRFASSNHRSRGVISSISFPYVVLSLPIREPRDKHHIAESRPILYSFFCCFKSVVPMDWITQLFQTPSFPKPRVSIFRNFL